MTKKPAHSASDDAGQGPAFPLFHYQDLKVALLILAICAFMFWRTTLFDGVPASLAQNVQPQTFPQLLLIMISGMALLLPFEHLQKRKQGIDLDSDRSIPPKPIVFVTGIAMLILVGIMPILGTLLGLLLAAAGLPLLWGERRLKLLIPYVLLFPTLLYLLFSSGLQVHFLPGMLGNWLG